MARLLNSLLAALILAGPADAAWIGVKRWPGMDRAGEDVPEEPGGRFIAAPCSDTGMMETPPGGRLAAPPGVEIEDLTPFGGRLLVSTDAWKSIDFESPAFGDGRQMPVQFGCSGDGMSPPLRWSEVPAGTKSMVVIVDDVDYPKIHDEPFVQWLAYNIPAGLGSLPEGASQDTKGPLAGNQGQNGNGKTGWAPPCPPCGTHRYHFKIYALKEYLNLKPGSSKTRLLGEMTDKILGRGDFIGRYSYRSKP
jgi:Raf kinase inhibitor-like YbhB/YbcL family protein